EPTVLVDHCNRISGRAHRGVAAGMELGRDRGPDVGRQRVVRAHRLLRQQGDLARVAGDLRLGGDLPGEADTLNEPPQILRVAGEVEMDPWWDPRVGARKL